MEKRRRLKPAVLMAMIIAASWGCGGDQQSKNIPLPAQQGLPLSLGWGVVLTNYIRIRATPAADGIEITALAKGAVVKVLDKDRLENVRDVTDYWYQIDDGRNRGWLFGQHLQVFHTKDEAEKRARELP